jgi:hypothetical protein
MLSSGTLGPEGGWDARIDRVLPGERVTLDTESWRIERHVEPVRFEVAAGLDRREHARRFAAVLDEAASELRFDREKWVLPLSGGVDSRGLLAMLHKHVDIRTITWGLNSATKDPQNDATIAAQIAAKFDVENRFFSTNLSSAPREQLVERFLLAGEGRVANIPPFLDGFSVWSALHDEGLDGIVRGDEAFGCHHVRNDTDFRRTSNLTMLSDYFDASTLASFELPPQSLPERLWRQPAETLPAWRDRLYQQHRLPKLLAGVTDLQAGYVEVVNPLLSRRILECVRTLPDELRTKRRLWREFVRTRSGDAAFARSVAVLPLRQFLNDTGMIELMLSELDRDSTSLAPRLRTEICAKLRATLQTDASERHRPGPREILGSIAPLRLRDAVRRWLPATITVKPTELAFRALIVSRMHSLLATDAALLVPTAKRLASS